MIDFLRSVQEADGGFEARYRPDGTGSPDARERQSDGAAWALWGTAQVLAATKDDDERLDAAGRALRHGRRGVGLPDAADLRRHDDAAAGAGLLGGADHAS